MPKSRGKKRQENRKYSKAGQKKKKTTPSVPKEILRNGCAQWIVQKKNKNIPNVFGLAGGEKTTRDEAS